MMHLPSRFLVYLVVVMVFATLIPSRITSDAVPKELESRILRDRLKALTSRLRSEDAAYEHDIHERAKGTGPTQCEDKLPSCASLRANGFCEPQYYFEGAMWNSVKDCLKTCELCHMDDPRVSMSRIIVMQPLTLLGC